MGRAPRSLSGHCYLVASAGGSTLASLDSAGDLNSQTTVSIIDAGTGAPRSHFAISYRPGPAELSADGSRLATLLSDGSQTSGRWRLYDSHNGRMVGSPTLDEPWGYWDPALRYLYTVATPRPNPQPLL